MFLILSLFLAACDAGFGMSTTPTESLLKTIHPATLTAISAAAAQISTPEPDQLDLHWSDLRGLEIEFWYIWDLDEPGTGMNAIVDRFNQENEWDIHVTPVDQGLTHDPLSSVETAFVEGLVPQVMISDAPAAVSWYQAGLTVDLLKYLSDPAAGLSQKDQKDYYEGILDSFFIKDGILPGIPFTQLVQGIYYNQTWAAELGFSYAPGSSDELIDQACKAAEMIQTDQQNTGGIILYPEAANVVGWLYAYGGSLFDPEDRSYRFSTSEMINVARDWQDLVRDQCGLMISQYPNPMAREIEFARFNNREALMMMNSTQYLEQIHPGPNQSGRADDWTMLPFLGPDGTKAVTSEIQSGVIFKTSPEEQLAAWLFLKYLTSPEVQAEWVQYSFYYPTRKDSLRFLRDFKTANPAWAEGVNILNYALAEPLDPSWEVVQQAVGDAFEYLLLEDFPGPIELLAELNQTAEELRVIGD